MGGVQLLTYFQSNQADNYSMGTPVTQFARLEDRAAIDVFIVSSNAKLRQDLHDKLGLPRWNAIQAASGAGALEVLHKHGVEDGILLMDPMLPDLEPNEFHAMVQGRFPNIQILTVNAQTGQLLIGIASPTAVSTRLAEIINRSGTVAPATLTTMQSNALRDIPEGRIHLRGMIGNSEPM